MNYFRRILPSLDMLVFFEAAARFRNYTHAAKELHVSQVAVSKRIRALEAEIGKPLFQRKGRALELTPEGQLLAERVEAGLAFLEQAIAATRGVSRKPRQVVQLAANENINFFWLAPLIRDFQMSGNDAVVSVVTANNVTDVVRGGTDLAIFHGKSPPGGWVAHELFEELIAPVVSPGYLGAMESGAPSGAVTRLDYGKEAPEWVNWQSLPPAIAGHWFPQSPVRQCSSYIQSISLAMEGAGIGLGVVPMLARELQGGQLTALEGKRWRTGNSYFLATPEGKSTSAATQDLITFLITSTRMYSPERRK